MNAPMIWHPGMSPKAKRWDERRVTINSVEPKYDGHRYTLIKHTSGRVEFLSRNLMPRPDVVDWLIPSHYPNNTVIEGEVVAPSNKGSDVITSLNECTARWHPFAIARWSGRRISTFDERDYLLGGDAPIAVGGKIRELSYEFLAAHAAENGLEGYMLKEQQYYGWWKVKPVWTVDAVVVGTTPGKGKNLNRIGSLQVAFKDHDVVSSVGKGNDEDWRDLSHEKCIGRVVEITYEEIGAGGRLKFSRFKCWRDDKPPEECTLFDD